jgi:hypothetical protein
VGVSTSATACISSSGESNNLATVTETKLTPFASNASMILAKSESDRVGRSSYWKLLIDAATRYQHAFGTAVTLAIMGYHFCTVTEEICQADASVGRSGTGGQAMKDDIQAPRKLLTELQKAYRSLPQHFQADVTHVLSALA